MMERLARVPRILVVTGNARSTRPRLHADTTYEFVWGRWASFSKPTRAVLLPSLALANAADDGVPNVSLPTFTV